MLIYYITLICTILFATIGVNNRRTVRISKDVVKYEPAAWCVVVVSIPLIAFAGLRYQVGSDWYAYYKWSHDTFRMYLNSSEMGWSVLGYIATLFFDGPGVGMFAASLVTIWLFVKTISKNSEDFVLAMLMFFFLIWHGTFNGVRQYLAAAVIFAGHRAMFDKKLLKWVVICLIAFLFHNSAIIVLPFYFIVNRQLDIKQVTVLAVISIFLYFSYDRIFDLIGLIKGETIDYESGYAGNEINQVRIIVYWMPVIFYWIIISRKQHTDYDKELNFYANWITLNAMLMSVSMNSAYLGRVCIYTNCFLTLAWPKMIKKLSRQDEKIIYLVIIAAYFLYWLYDITSHPDLNNFRLVI